MRLVPIMPLLYLRRVFLLIFAMLVARWLFVPRFTHRLKNDVNSRIRQKHCFTELKDMR